MLDDDDDDDGNDTEMCDDDEDADEKVAEGVEVVMVEAQAEVVHELAEELLDFENAIPWDHVTREFTKSSVAKRWRNEVGACRTVPSLARLLLRFRDFMLERDENGEPLLTPSFCNGAEGLASWRALLRHEAINSRDVRRLLRALVEAHLELPAVEPPRTQQGGRGRGKA